MGPQLSSLRWVAAIAEAADPYFRTGKLDFYTRGLERFSDEPEKGFFAPRCPT